MPFATVSWQVSKKYSPRTRSGSPTITVIGVTVSCGATQDAELRVSPTAVVPPQPVSSNRAASAVSRLIAASSAQG